MKFLSLALIRCYRIIVSPLLPAACRFVPTCSNYASDSIKLHGLVKGGLLALRRVARCHPWGKSGYDPVHPKKEKEIHSCLSFGGHLHE